jgi:hypothetical protein
MLAASMTLSLIVIQLPWFIADTPDPDSIEVRVMTIDMLCG